MEGPAPRRGFLDSEAPAESQLPPIAHDLARSTVDLAPASPSSPLIEAPHRGGRHEGRLLRFLEAGRRRLALHASLGACACSRCSAVQQEREKEEEVRALLG